MMDWNDGKRQVEIRIQKQKQWSFATIFFYSDFDADVTRKTNLAGKAYLKITLLVKTLLHENREVASSG